MDKGILFWVLMVIWLVFGFVGERFEPWARTWGNTLLIFVLFALLGWRVFGPAVN
jgi:hypothetical protein